MGLDLYDVDSNTPNTSTTFSTLANEPYGLNAFEAFASAQGKPMSFPEWGLSSVPSGDDPGYIDGMASAVANGDFAFESYFDAGGGNALALGSSTTPLSLGAYQDWFGTPSAECCDDLGNRDGRWWWGPCRRLRGRIPQRHRYCRFGHDRRQWDVHDFGSGAGQLRRHVRSGLRRR